VEFALAWYLTIKTGSATVLATAMLVAFLPQIILGPLIGPFIDRWDRKRIMIVADLSIALITFILVALFFFNAIQVWHIYMALLLRTIGQSFHFPAMQAAIPMIVSDKDLPRAAGLNQMLQGVVTIAGPPAGAMLLGLLPMQWVLSVDIITAIIAVGCLLPILIPHPVRSAAAVKTSVISEMMEGLRYIWRWKGLRILIGLSALITVLLVPTFTLLPILVTSHLEGDVFRLGWLNSAFGVGMIAGGLLLGAWRGFKRNIVTCLMGVILSGAATIGLGMTTVGLFFFGVASSFLVGVGLSVANAPIMAVLQTVVAREMQGRIFSLFGSISAIMVPLGLAIAGPTADAVGILPLFYVTGIVVVLIGMAGFFIRPLMNLEKPAGEVPTPDV
jgi:MFS transporter, DHA3 family, macrolide efflux protein